MRIFVTGGAGFIGSNFIRHVLDTRKSFSIVNYDQLTYAGNLANLESVADNPDYEFVKGDICDAAAVETAMRGCDAVIHFAAESHLLFCSRWHVKSLCPDLCIFPLTKCTGTFHQGPSPMKIFRFSRAVRTPRRKRPLISWFGRTSVLTSSPR